MRAHLHFLICFFLQTALIASHLEQELLPYEFHKISDSPEVYECEHFITDAECDMIIEEARPNLTRSTVIDNNSTTSMLDDRRTSLGTFLSAYSKNAALQKIRRQAEEITGIPRENGEGLQVLYYSIGAEYQPHFDYFDPTQVGGAVHYNRGGQRVATLLVYLNTAEQGGETVFPKGPLAVKATKGKAVLFYNVDLQGRPDPQSFHGGAPVISGGKWVATLWLRENTFH